MFEVPESKKEKIDIDVTPLQEKDVAELDSILREHIRDRKTGEIEEKEIERLAGFMRGNHEQTDGKVRVRNFLVAKDKNGKVLGCMAHAQPEQQMIEHFGRALNMDHQELEDKSAELLHAFVSSDIFRGSGVGRELFSAICEAAKKDGKELILVNSGPRYAASWGFYDKMEMKRCGYIIGKYGEGGDAMTWVKSLGRNKDI